MNYKLLLWCMFAIPIFGVNSPQDDTLLWSYIEGPIANFCKESPGNKECTRVSMLACQVARGNLGGSEKKDLHHELNKAIRNCFRDMVYYSDNAARGWPYQRYLSSSLVEGVDGVLFGESIDNEEVTLRLQSTIVQLEAFKDAVQSQSNEDSDRGVVDSGDVENEHVEGDNVENR